MDLSSRELGEEDMTIQTFESRRISKTSVITLNAPLKEVFPLFGPIMEKEWAAGWEPQLIYSITDLVEEHMVFRTKSHLGHEPDFTWIISKYSPDQSFIEYTVFTHERLWWISIQCREGITGGTTDAEITYIYTGLTEKGNVINASALEMMYHQDLKDWEESINHYLETGERFEQR